MATHRDEFCVPQNLYISPRHSVKCVIIGDVGVGKTCLVSTKAAGIQYVAQDLFQPSKSSVWSADSFLNSHVSFVIDLKLNPEFHLVFNYKIILY